MGLSFLETNRDSCCKYLNLSISKQNNLAKSVYDELVISRFKLIP